MIARGGVDAIGLFTLADARPGLIRRALDCGLHVLAEKPLGATIADEEALLHAIEASGRLVAVNLFNRNTWYHRAMREFVAAGAIGQLAILDIAHLTPDLLPTKGHQPEGPPFHDCGMHYVDLARWYAGSEYADWHAQGLRIWAWPDPWWLGAHGSFQTLGSRLALLPAAGLATILLFNRNTEFERRAANIVDSALDALLSNNG